MKITKNPIRSKEVKLQPKLRFSEFDEDWEFVTLQEVSSKIGDGLHGTPEYVNDSEYFFINGNNLSNGVINIFSNSKKVSETIFFKNDKKLNQNSILISLNGTIGSIAKYNNEKIMLSKSVGFINFSNDSDLFYHILNTKKVQNFFESELTGSTIKNLSLKTLRDTIISIPQSLPEQTKIASFLTTVDEKISGLKKQLNLLERYKKGVMQKIFSQELRFKDENGSEFPDWEEKKLGEFCVKKSSNISANKIEDNYGEYIIYGASGVLKKVNFYQEENDYVSIVKDGAGVGRLLYCKGFSSVLGTLEMICPKGNLNTYFLYCLLLNIDFTKYVTGSTIPHIYFKDYSLEKCFIPSLPEQQKIATFLSSIDEKIEKCQGQIKAMENWKKGLLQQMFC